jgi:two-component sensor histidine kinase
MPVHQMPGQSRTRGLTQYLAALFFVLLAYGARVAIDPLVGDTRLAFSIFYLAVVFSAYFAGGGPAILTAILSAILAYWAFVAPAYAMKMNPEALTSMLFFGLTSAVDIYFITGMRRALREYRGEQQRAEQLAKGNADLFREFNERTTTHLQLVAALLHLRARDDVDSSYANALADASRRTLMISRVHRNLNHGAVPLTDFSGFARQLLAACVEATPNSDIKVTVSGDDILLPGEQATSMATILFEFVRFTLRHQPGGSGGTIDVQLTATEMSYRLRLSSLSATVPGDQGLMNDEMTRQVIDAMTDHLHGHFITLPISQGIAFELNIPTDIVGAPRPKFDIPTPASSTLH